MNSLLTMLLPSLVPALADGLRGIFSRLSGGSANPQNVQERIQLMNADVQRLTALAALDTPSGNISPWVADLRGSFRYLAVGSIILATLTGVMVAPDSPAVMMLLDLSGASMSFIIGERMYLGLRK